MYILHTAAPLQIEGFQCQIPGLTLRGELAF